MRYGIIIGIIVGLIGCGDVTTAERDGGDDAAGTTGTAGTGMSGGSSGTTGSGGQGGRPLGAGCADDSECGSGICASGACCDGRPDACNTCVNGYKTPVADGTTCGDPVACSGTDRVWSACTAGTCAPQVVHCKAATCDKKGNPVCPGMTGLCGVDNDPCYCPTGMADPANVISYPCP